MSTSPAITLTTSSPSTLTKPDETQIHLYAELHLHIRTISLTASLSTSTNPATTATLSADGSSITVSHEGASASIRLPSKIGKGGEAKLDLPEAPGKELVLRLRLEEWEREGLLRVGEEAGSVVPWDAAALGELADGGAEMRCRKCEARVMALKGVGMWLDLPNENWAEMMDFWHCHKPDDGEHGHGHTHGGQNGDAVGAKKGYAAANKLKAVKGTGWVGVDEILFNQDDCEGVKTIKSEIDAKDVHKLSCGSCGSVIGIENPSADGWVLWKWALAVDDGKEEGKGKRTSYDIQKWIAAKLLALVENQSIRKFQVHDENHDPENAGVLLWVFTPDMSFSSSVRTEDRLDPTRAMKLFWQPAASSSEGSSFTIEELHLPSTLFNALQKGLADSADLLPASARKFQGWNVALLERFATVDLGTNNRPPD